jgi:hypothetical protein
MNLLTSMRTPNPMRLLQNTYDLIVSFIEISHFTLIFLKHLMNENNLISM